MVTSAILLKKEMRKRAVLTQFEVISFHIIGCNFCVFVCVKTCANLITSAKTLQTVSVDASTVYVGMTCLHSLAKHTKEYAI